MPQTTWSLTTLLQVHHLSSWSIPLTDHCQAASQHPLHSEVAKVCISHLLELMDSNTTSPHMLYKIATLPTSKLQQLRMLDPNRKDQVINCMELDKNAVTNIIIWLNKNANKN
ncbi:hypothetical protein GOODEAATRI_032839 [Goodea atripinnis]|uniref:Uncharacterized protein n=1 Tax=Goodea atripinnis TaxID=208336 RepID=A0ABV0NZU5_9TELE